MSELSRHARRLGEESFNELAATHAPMGFIPNPAMQAELEGNPLMVEAMKSRAEQGAEAAKNLAPVETGDYRDSIQADAGIEDGAAKGRVVATDFKAGWIEFGTVQHDAHAPIRRGVESIGVAVKPKHGYKGSI